MTKVFKPFNCITSLIYCTLNLALWSFHQKLRLIVDCGCGSEFDVEASYVSMWYIGSDLFGVSTGGGFRTSNIVGTAL